MRIPTTSRARARRPWPVMSGKAWMSWSSLTGGERGDILNKAMERPDVRANLPRIRREEMARAREILGVQQQFLGFIDSGLPEGDPLPPLPEGCFALQSLEEAAGPLVRAVREFRP